MNTTTKKLTGIELHASDDLRRWSATLNTIDANGKRGCAFIYNLSEADVTRVLAAQRALVRRYDTAHPGEVLTGPMYVL